ncbi:hypothetical protein K08M4_17050 [Vibrio syngnathi]|uniref:Uncharacterized protein n=1 Tax=Vibrio syngnathi TaxID=3034029 RepID=A0AA34TP38_9VIBR|nr:hypothetical protein K08M4_17050 [Vibrio syngnathi]
MAVIYVWVFFIQALLLMEWVYLCGEFLLMMMIGLSGLVVDLYPNGRFVQFNSKNCGYSVVFRGSFDKMKRPL